MTSPGNTTAPALREITQDFVWENDFSITTGLCLLRDKETAEDKDGKIDIALPEDSALFIAKPVRAELIARETALRATELERLFLLSGG